MSAKEINRSQDRPHDPLGHELEGMENRCLMSTVMPPGVQELFSGPGGEVPPAIVSILEDLATLENFASIDGSGNNLDNPDWGAIDTQLIRLTTPEYEDGLAAPAGEDRPSAREVSNAVAAQTGSIVNDRYLTNMLWLWGQFIDHDIDLTEHADPAEAFNIEVPTGDPYFDPFGTGTQEIGLNRSNYDPETGVADARQQLNQITAFIDGSVVYGSDQERADALRTFEGGKLKTSDGDLLPYNEEGLANAGGASDALFLAGDIRANENVALTAMQTIWVREHNWWAGQIAGADPTLSDEQIYQQARAIVTAELQAITYNEFLPALLGAHAIQPYRGYDPEVDASIANIFSTAAYRLGHSLLSEEIPLVDENGDVVDSLALQDAFFSPSTLVDAGVDAILGGMASSLAQELDNKVIDDVRNFLFGPPGAGGFDLASLNIQRGRDHGLPDYNQARADLGLAPVTSFDQITSDAAVAASLEAVYGDVDLIDVWVGALAEDHVNGGSVGELMYTILVDQFTRLRDGDRFWYQNTFEGQTLRAIDSTRLADVIERNTNLAGLQDNVFFDASVMHINVDNYSRRGGEVRIVAEADKVKVFDDHGHLVQQRDVSGLSQIVLIGNAYRPDQVTLDLRQADLALPGGLLLESGPGGRDSLRILTGRQIDDITASGDSVSVNGFQISYDDLERVLLDAGRGGPDQVTIDDDTSAEVDVISSRPRRSVGPFDERLDLQRRDQPRLFDQTKDDERDGGMIDMLLSSPTRLVTLDAPARGSAPGSVPRSTHGTNGPGEPGGRR